MNGLTPPNLERFNPRRAEERPWDALPIPSVVMRDVSSRPRSPAHIIVFANEKGGVGKSTLALHSAIALSYSGANVLTVDLDGRQRSLATALTIRSGTAASLEVNLPMPKSILLNRQSGAMLDQEISRLSKDIDFVIIDLPGFDAEICRYAIAIANTLVTPVGNSTFDISGLGAIDLVTRKMKTIGPFGELISDIIHERDNFGFAPLDWLVVKNRTRSSDQRLEAHITKALEQMAKAMNFRIGEGLPERLGFRDLLSYGLTYLDLRLIPGLGKRRLDFEGIIVRMLSQLDLPGFQSHQPKWERCSKYRARVSTSSKVAYATSLHLHVTPVMERELHRQQRASTCNTASSQLNNSSQNPQASDLALVQRLP
jgi:chromosome partitioning protein